MEIKPRKYNWPLIIRDTMDSAFMPQAAMADKLKVSQQSISNWASGKRNPRIENLPELLKLAKDTGLDIHKYEANPDIYKITVYLKKNNPREFIRLLELYDRMSRVGKKKFLGYAERLKT